MPTASKTTGSQFDEILKKRKPETAKTGREERLAKSKDPEFRPANFYLRKQTLAECEYRLKTLDDSRDMSELIEELLDGWLKAQNAK
jgi:hypothetical protein